MLESLLDYHMHPGQRRFEMYLELEGFTLFLFMRPHLSAAFTSLKLIKSTSLRLSEQTNKQVDNGFLGSHIEYLSPRSPLWPTAVHQGR